MKPSRYLATGILLFTFLGLLTSQISASKTGSSPDPSAILDVSGNDGGLLIPRMTKTQRDAIVDPAHALMIYQTDDTPGFYYNSGTTAIPNWVIVGGANCMDRILIDEIPFTITAPGSYYINQHLTAAAAINGITVNSSNVNIDLNGFTLDGASSLGTNAIVLSSGIKNITITNGHVDNWDQNGISGSSAELGNISYLSVSNCGLDGISLGHDWNLNHCSVTGNGFDGIDTKNNAVISHCTTVSNNSDGIETGENCTISNCASRDNDGSGFLSGKGSVVSYCTAQANDFHGYDLGNGSNVKHSSSTDNAQAGFYLNAGVQASHNTATINGTFGIRISSDGFIINNNLDSNSGNAIFITNDNNTIEGNVITDHSIAINIIGNNNLVVKNKVSNCPTSHTAPVGNLIAVFLNSGDFAGSSIPYANISY